MIPIKIPDTCPCCRTWPLTRVTIDGAGEAFASVQMLTEKQARSGEILIGGTQVICQPYVCKACGFFALFYDDKASHNKWT